MKPLPAKRLVLLCYAAAVLGWLLLSFAAFVYDRTAPTVTLPVEQATLVGLEQQEDGNYLTTTGDPQLVFPTVNQRVRRVQLVGEFFDNPGEMDAYYTRSSEAGFSPRRRVWGALQEDGGYLYTLPPGSVSALRIDTGTAPFNTATLTAVVLNPQIPFSRYLLPNLGTLLGLALLPPFAAAIIYTIIEVLFSKRKHKAV